MRALFKLFSSIWLTVTLLGLSMILVFASTLEQTELGVFEVQKQFFESFVCLWHYPTGLAHWENLQWLKIPLPGGFLLGALLLVNLGCAHFRYFRPTWRKSGIVLIHAGIVLLIISGFLTAYLQEEYFMWINVGGSANYVESFHDRELAFIDHSDPKTDTVISVPVSRLAGGQVVSDPALPFTITPVYYYPNSSFTLRSENKGRDLPVTPADHGVATNGDLAVVPQPYDYAKDELNTASAVVTVSTKDGPVGKWLVSTLFSDPNSLPPFLKDKFPQTFVLDGHTWEVTLRPRRVYLPCTLTLDKFVHEVYPGTDVPKDFESQVHLTNAATGEDRPVLIYMNHPLRYAGLTFYQASFGQSDTASMLQVVRNPGAPLPYIAVALVGVGMTLHFLLSLATFLRRERQTAEAPSTGATSPDSALPQTAAIRTP